MLDRWRKLHDELYDSVKGFDITKVRQTKDCRAPQRMREAILT